jgi:hypothetical protein
MPVRCGAGGRSASGALGGGGVQKQLGLFAGLPSQEEGAVALPKPTVGEDLLADYNSLGTTLGPHPLALLRGELKARAAAVRRNCWRSSTGSRSASPGW